MAIVLSDVKKLSIVKIISKSDSALDLDRSDWEAYESDLIANEHKLVFKTDQEPTVFVCKFDLSGKEAAIAKDAMIGGVDEDKQVKLSYGKWAYTVVRMVLKEIKNPAGVSDTIELKKDSKGYVDEYTMSLLEQAGVVSEIFNHYVSLTQTDVKGEAKN